MSTNSLPIQQTANSNKVMSFLLLRQIIGSIGISLPFLLIIGTGCLDEYSPAFQSSISHYYYTKMHMLFVGLLCVLGGFLITYRGSSNSENYISSFAGICSILVSVFPDDTVNYIYNDKKLSFIQTQKLNDYVPDIHFASATLLFLSFAALCYFFFIDADDPNANPIKKQRRNIVYRTCGIGILLSLILCYLFLKDYLNISEDFDTHSVLIFETTALVFFGFSWLLKGSLMWTNKKYLLPFIIKYFR